MVIPPRSRGIIRARADRSPVARTLLPLQHYLHMEGVSGGVLVAAAAAGLLWANSPWAGSYDALWEMPVRVGIGAWTIFDDDLRHVVNDGLMAVFFFVVGLEIKRELYEGALADRRRAMLPVAAAVGGMVAPALLYIAVVGGGPAQAGWGIPMATDIAFAVAVLSLAAVRHELKVLLLAVAIVDDIGAILVIAVFYTAGFSWGAAGMAGLCVLLVLGMQRAGFQHIGFYAPVAFIFWIAVLESGVHATIAGVILGALTPAVAAVPAHDFARDVGRLGGDLSAALESGNRDEAEMLASQVEELGRQSESPLDRAERLFHPWSSYAILPLFALANSGVVITGASIGDAAGSPVTWGIVLGLLIGKPLGVGLFAWAAARAGIASLPDGVRWRDVLTIGWIAGIGFTVSIFITNLAFTEESLVTPAKIGIFAASLVAAIVGWIAARRIASSD